MKAIHSRNCRKALLTLACVGVVYIVASRDGNVKRYENVVKEIDAVEVSVEEDNWYLGVCGQTRGSGAWIREWLELQLIAGVDHVWLVDDNTAETEDGTRSVLEYYVEKGFLTVIEEKMPAEDPGCAMNKKVQNWEHNCIAPKFCARHVGDKVSWLIFADTDEFIYPHHGCSLSKYVRSTCNPYQSHVSIRWERFGTNGFTHHPLGLMTENFLSSGGSCAHVTAGQYSRPAIRNLCLKSSFNFCLECRHMKVMYNMQRCMTTDHVGWVHWAVNTSEWKAKNKQFIQSPGEGSNFKSDKCVLTTWDDDDKQCSAWLATGGGSKADVEFSEDCCSAGIGYNHYGTKSLQYYNRKTVRKKEDVRGFRTELEMIDLEGVVSYSVLRFLRALRTRFRSLGIPVSANVGFYDFATPTHGEGTAFIESNTVYTANEPLGTTTTTTEEPALTTQSCATACHATPSCAAFTYHIPSSTCTLLHPPDSLTLDGRSLGRRQWPRSHIPANRSWHNEHASGIILRDGECPAPPGA
eukprot:TRINITY_DN16141_c0_g1_i1.p1 TRINITY_DN16141_c0_g1~~TRINITY_DN16141_c0_g1_i1.p1  ORF type:complete len:523 (+),score=53.79 TRINITY_DN16141_c0_g1_i1:44-1612(+)